MKQLVVVSCMGICAVGCGEIKKANPTPEDADQHAKKEVKFGEDFSIQGDLEPLANEEELSGKSYAHSLTAYFVLQVIAAGEVRLEEKFVAARSCEGSPQIGFSIIRDGSYATSMAGEVRVPSGGFDGFVLGPGIYKVMVNAYTNVVGCSVLTSTLRFLFTSQ